MLFGVTIHPLTSSRFEKNDEMMPRPVKRLSAECATRSLPPTGLTPLQTRAHCAGFLRERLRLANRAA